MQLSGVAELREASNNLLVRQKSRPSCMKRCTVSPSSTHGGPPHQEPEGLLHSTIVRPLSSLISGFPCKGNQGFTTLMHPIVKKTQNKTKTGFCSLEFSDERISASYVTIQTSRWGCTYVMLISLISFIFIVISLLCSDPKGTSVE